MVDNAPETSEAYAMLLSYVTCEASTYISITTGIRYLFIRCSRDEVRPESGNRI